MTITESQLIKIMLENQHYQVLPKGSLRIKVVKMEQAAKEIIKLINNTNGIIETTSSNKIS